jgi:prolyl-tRNA synthetase
MDFGRHCAYIRRCLTALSCCFWNYLMPTKWTKTLIPTSRQAPADAEVPSHQLLLRAGYIRKVAAGVYDYLPLGLRSLRKAAQIVRQEMDGIGAAEVSLPVLQPIELWEKTGRRSDYGQNLLVVTDRHGREQALGPTHEEIITELAGAYIESHKDLPLTLYQIQTKFRDELRPRFGVLRCREFLMKDAYSFHLHMEGPGGLDETYQQQYEAYQRIFKRCGVPYQVVEAEAGPIGGNASHEFMVPAITGEDTILESDKGNYAANVEKCGIGKREFSFDGEPTGDSKLIATPNVTTISDLCSLWKEFTGGKLKPQNALKTLVYRVEGQLTTQEKDDVKELKEKYDWEDDGFVFNWIVVIRGDHELNEAKFKNELLKIHGREMSLHGKDVGLTLMDDIPAKNAGFKIGYVGPDAYHSLANTERMRTYVMVDHNAAQPGFWVAGGNQEGYHRMHFNWARECTEGDHIISVADIRNAADGDPSPKNDGGVLREKRGIELGHIFKLGTKYSVALDATVRDENNEAKPMLMGCYGIGINRILASAIEQEHGHDDGGIIWPTALAPYSVIITPIKYEGDVKQTADQLAVELEHRGLDVLLDDRDQRPGVKFNDADLIGIPLRIAVGEKGLKDGNVELKARDGSLGDRGVTLPVGDVVDKAVEVLGSL